MLPILTDQESTTCRFTHSRKYYKRGY